MDIKASPYFEDFVKIVKVLRKECPWDREQTHESLKNDLIEEAYEAVDAIDEQNMDALKKELGDLLLHIVFHSQIAFEDRDFAIDDVIQSIQEKMIYRHPHVFGDAEVKNKEQLVENWETLKMKEGRESALDGIPGKLPALMAALQMQKKAGTVGFDWQKSNEGEREVWQKLEEEINEFKEVYEQKDRNTARITEEYGDILFSLVNIGRFLDLQAEEALRMTNKKFRQRFQYIENKFIKPDKPCRKLRLKRWKATGKRQRNGHDKQ